MGHEIPSLQGASEDEKSIIWYDKYFYKEMKQSIIRDATTIETIKSSSNNKNDDGQSSRALNNSQRRESIMAVIEEQFRQSYMHIKKDYKLLAMVYVQYSSQCQKFAHNKALQNEREVLKYLVGCQDNSSSVLSI